MTKKLLAFDPIQLVTTMLTCGWFNFSLHGRPGDNITGLFHLYFRLQPPTLGTPHPFCKFTNLILTKLFHVSLHFIFLAQASFTSASGTIMATKDWKRRMYLFKLLFSFNVLKYYEQTLKLFPMTKACATKGLRKYTFWIFSGAINSPCFRKKNNHHLK